MRSRPSSSALAAQLFGWKIAATSEAGQKHINVAGPDGRAHPAPTRVIAGRRHGVDGTATRCASPSRNLPSAWRVDLPPRPSPYSGRRRCSPPSTPCIPRSRFRIRALPISSAPARRRSSPTMPARICSCWARLRPPNWRALDLVEERPVITLRGQRYVGHGKNVLGDPRVALTWLANELRGLGMTLKGRGGGDDRHLSSAAADSVRRSGGGGFRRAGESVGGVQVRPSPRHCKERREPHPRCPKIAEPTRMCVAPIWIAMA